MRAISVGKKVMQINKKESGSPLSWKVTDSMVHTVPDDYDVSRSSRFITGTDASVICARLDNVFKKILVIASYDSKKAKAKCVTKNFVKLQVRLFRGRGQYSCGIIVEVVRRCGSRIDFVKDCSAILNAAEGKKNINSGSFNNSPHMRQPVSSLKCLRNASFLKNEVRDINGLGVENFCSLLKLNAADISTNESAEKATAMIMDIAQVRIH